MGGMSEFSSLEDLILNAFLKYVCSVQNKATEFKRETEIQWPVELENKSSL